MPYNIEVRDGKHCVVKETTNEVVGCHESEEQAKEHLRALYANEPDAGRKHILGQAVKSLDDNGRVGGYLVVWGDENNRDTSGEYFTPDTNLYLDWYKERPILFHHGLDGTIKSFCIGTIQSVKTDDVGLWVEGILDMRDKYVKRISELVKMGMLDWSSGSVPHLVKTIKGHILEWPIVEGSLTPTPCEPRATAVSLKALQEIDDYLRTFDNETPDRANGLKGCNCGGDNLSNKQTTKQNQNGVNEMTPEELAALIERAAERAVEKYIEAMREEQPMADEEERAAMQAMTDEAKAVAEDAMTDEEKDKEEAQKKASKAIMAEMTRIISAGYNEVHKVKNGQYRQIKDAMKQARGNMPAPSARQLAGVGTPNKHISVRDRHYDSMSAEDLSFMAAMAQYQSGGIKSVLPYTLDEKFYRAFAVKADKAMQSGQYITPEIEQRVNAIKSDELDYSTQASYGDEVVPTMWSTTFWDKARMDNVILANITSIDMPSNPFILPVESADPTVYYIAETKNENQLTLADSNSPIPDSKIGTASITLTASKFGLRVGISGELNEDSIPATIPLFRRQAERAMEDAIDHAAINGDTATSGNVNYDGGTPAATSIYMAYNGLIKDALVTNSTNAVLCGGIITLAKMRETRFKLARAYAARPKDLMWVVDAYTYSKMLGLDEFSTMDKAGSLATAQTGQLGFVDGIPLFVSDQLLLADTDGKITYNAAGTTGRAVILHRPSVYFGFRRQIVQAFEYISAFDAWQLTVMARNTLAIRDNDSVAILYNITV